MTFCWLINKLELENKILKIKILSDKYTQSFSSLSGHVAWKNDLKGFYKVLSNGIKFFQYGVMK